MTTKVEYKVTLLLSDTLKEFFGDKMNLARKAKILREEIIELDHHPEREDDKQDLKTKLKMRLRKVCYQDKQNRYFEFLTNNFDISAEDIAFATKKDGVS